MDIQREDINSKLGWDERGELIDANIDENDVNFVDKAATLFARFFVKQYMAKKMAAGSKSKGQVDSSEGLDDIGYKYSTEFVYADSRVAPAIVKTNQHAAWAIA